MAEREQLLEPYALDQATKPESEISREALLAFNGDEDTVALGLDEMEPEHAWRYDLLQVDDNDRFCGKRWIGKRATKAEAKVAKHDLDDLSHEAWDAE